MLIVNYKDFERFVQAMSFVKRPSQVKDKAVASSVLMTYDNADDTIVMVGSNYQASLSMSLDVSSDEVLPAWSLVVPFDVISSFFAGSPPTDGNVTLRSTEDPLSFILVAGRRKMKIKGYSPDVFPFFNPLEEIDDYSRCFKIGAYDFVSSISFGLSTTGGDDAPPVLAGVHFNRYMVHNKAHMDVLGADGVRLTAAMMQPINDMNAEGNFTLSMFGMPSILRSITNVLGDLNEVVFDLYDNDSSVIVLSPENKLVLKVLKISGNYPDYRRAIPTFTASTVFEISLSAFAGLLKSAFAISNRISFDVLKNLDVEGVGNTSGILMTAYNDNDAAFQYAIPVSDVTAERYVALDTKYLMATLSSFRGMGYDSVTMEFSQKDKPVIVRPVASDSAKVVFSPLAILSPVLATSYVERKKSENKKYQL